jgi:hypothetical protein
MLGADVRLLLCRDFWSERPQPNFVPQILLRLTDARSKESKAVGDLMQLRVSDYSPSSEELQRWMW